VNLRIHVLVLVYDRRGNSLDPYPIEVNMADSIKEVLGDGKGEVSMGLSKKIGGPQYSSVSLYVNVKLRCGQDEASIQQAQRLAMDEVLLAMDEHFDNAVELLKTSLRKHENFA
jgi:hypothetical protein